VLSAQGQRHLRVVRVVADRDRRKVVESVLVLGDQRDQTEVALSPGRLVDQDPDRTTLDRVRGELARLRAETQELEEGLVRDGRERGLVGWEIVEVADCHVDHFRIVLLLDDRPAGCAERILAVGFGLAPTNDDEVLLRVVMDQRIAFQLQDVVEATRCLVHDVDQRCERRVVSSECSLDQKHHLSARGGFGLLRWDQSARLLKRRDVHVEHRRRNGHASRERSNCLGVLELS